MSKDSDQQLANDSRFTGVSPGKLLLEGRERSGMTQDQVAKELYMTLSKVRLLESDDYGRFGSNTFARGYVRAYANLLKLDVEYVLAVYDAQAQRSGLAKGYVPPKTNNANVPLWRFMALIGAALTLLWLISMWFFDNRQEPVYAIKAPVATELAATSVQPSSAQASSVQNDFVVPDVATTDSMSSTAMSSAEASSVAADLTTSEPQAEIQTETQIETTRPVNASGLDEIRFLFKDECWLEVSDSRGDVLATELQRAGSELVVAGKAPFDVKLGNSPAVDMYLNGKKIAIVPALGTDVLTLKVSE